MFMTSDNLYPLASAGTGVFQLGPSDWVSYMATLNTTPEAGFDGFVLVLSTGTPRTSPAELYILLTQPATSVQATELDPLQLADGGSPSRLLPTPALVVSCNVLEVVHVVGVSFSLT